MRIFRPCFPAFCALLAFFAIIDNGAVVGAASVTENFVSTKLVGALQIPSAVVTNATGTISFVYNPAAAMMSWTLEISNPDNESIFGTAGAHIHCGAISDNGGVVVSLVTPDQADSSSEIAREGTIGPTDILPGQCVNSLGTLWLLLTRTGGSEVYVNVHSDEYPDGHLRGNTGPLSDGQAEMVQTTLLPETQVPPVVSNATGTATFVYNSVSETILHSLEIDNPGGVAIFGQVGAHIHCGTPDTNGGLLVPLYTGPATQSPFIGVMGFVSNVDISAGLCVETVPNLWLLMNREGGSEVYVNVHSTENPNGEIRGNFGGAVMDPPTMMPTVMPTNLPTLGPPSSTSMPPTKGPTSSPTVAPSSGAWTISRCVLWTLLLTFGMLNAMM